MRRRHIHSVCNSRWHPFPVTMRYGGRRWWYGQRVHVMYCPLCSHERLYVYDRFGRIRRAA